MVNSCVKCESGNTNDKDVTPFSISKPKTDNQWQQEFVKRLGPHIKDEAVNICSKHFDPDLEMKNSTAHVEENALFVKNEMYAAEPEDEEPEVIYVNYEVDPDEVEIGHSDNGSDTSETKEIVSLEPFIEYVDVYEQEEVEEIQSILDIKSELTGDQITENNCAVESKPQIISTMNSEEDDLEIEPMIPFLLTSSPVFTIMNENDEVGETIILQFEDQEERNPLNPQLINEHQKYLCKSSDQALTSKYACDICECYYGCLNCLKSHYETLHISHIITKYRCHTSIAVSKSNTCPVCELMFENRNQTLDHYITHAVACDICGSGFDRQLYLTEHYQSAHNMITEIRYECGLCKRLYRYPMTLTNHYQNFHKMILCYVCKLRFQSMSELQDHELVHRQKLNVLPFACSKCDKAFPKISDIAVHIRQDHKREYSIAKHPVFMGKKHTPCITVKEEVPAQKKVKLKK